MYTIVIYYERSECIMSLFGKDEVQDLLNVLSKLGYKKSDFDLTPHENKPCVGVSPILGNVSIKRNSNNCTYKYSVGRGSLWVCKFEEDLRVGKFGSP